MHLKLSPNPGEQKGPPGLEENKRLYLLPLTTGHHLPHSRKEGGHSAIAMAGLCEHPPPGEDKREEEWQLEAVVCGDHNDPL